MEPIVCRLTPAIFASCSWEMLISARASLKRFLNFDLSFNLSAPNKYKIAYQKLYVKCSFHFAKLILHLAKRSLHYSAYNGLQNEVGHPMKDGRTVFCGSIGGTATSIVGRGCPYCAGLKPVIGETDLVTISPSLAIEWNYEKNGSLTPNMVTGFSHKKVWWKCRYGHQWQASISSRSNGVGCPICSGHKVLQGENDLANEAPQLAAEWHPTMNGEVTPSGVTLHSNKSVWWQCTKGHAWKTTINNRANGSGCPFCNQQRLIPSETSLGVVKPLLANRKSKRQVRLISYLSLFVWFCFIYGLESQSKN